MDTWNPDHYVAPYTYTNTVSGLHDTPCLDLKSVGDGDDPAGRVFDADGRMVADGAEDAINKWQAIRASRGTPDRLRPLYAAREARRRAVREWSGEGDPLRG
jgi:hypothetical protein